MQLGFSAQQSWGGRDREFPMKWGISLASGEGWGGGRGAFLPFLPGRILPIFYPDLGPWFMKWPCHSEYILTSPDVYIYSDFKELIWSGAVSYFLSVYICQISKLSSSESPHDLYLVSSGWTWLECWAWDLNMCRCGKDGGVELRPWRCRGPMPGTPSAMIRLRTRNRLWTTRPRYISVTSWADILEMQEWVFPSQMSCQEGSNSLMA